MQVRLAEFVADHAAIRKVRFEVFVDEQRVPEDEEIDERDPACVHVLVFSDHGEPIGTGRIDLEAEGKIGRVAVSSGYRGRGVGTALMRLLHEVAAQHGLERVWCNAQTGAAPFYERLGYSTTSQQTFYEAGIEHVRMEARLGPRVGA